MAKASSSRAAGSSRGASDSSGGSAARNSANSRMWSQPATARQISALKSHGNFDGKFYSKGRAGQAIGESVRAAGSAASAAQPLGGGSRARRGEHPARITTGGPSTGLEPIGSALAPLCGEIAPAPIYTATPHAQAEATPTDVHTGEARLGGLSFALFNELKERHLRAFQAEHSSGWGSQLRDEAQEWARLRIRLAGKLTDAHGELVAILAGAPSGAFPNPAAAAWGLLASAFPYGIEEQHLRRFLSEHSSSWGSLLRDEIDNWAKSRIKLAKANARGLVAMLNTQAALAPAAPPPALPSGTAPAPATGRGQKRPQPKAPPRRTVPPIPSGKGRTYLATVVRINPHGAVVSLDGGEEGWLHVSRLRMLNGGARVESVSDVLEVGQRLRTRGIGTTDRGQVRLAIVGEAAATQVACEGLTAPTESASAPMAQTPVKRRGLLRRLALVRSTTESLG